MFLAYGTVYCQVAEDIFIHVLHQQVHSHPWEADTIQLTCILFIVELLQSALSGKRKSQVCSHVFRGV